MSIKIKARETPTETLRALADQVKTYLDKTARAADHKDAGRYAAECLRLTQIISNAARFAEDPEREAEYWRLTLTCVRLSEQAALRAYGFKRERADAETA